MKRTKFVVLSLVVGIMLTGAGYAATMTDQLNARNTVNAGFVDVKTTCTPTIKLASIANNGALTATNPTRKYNQATPENGMQEMLNNDGSTDLNDFTVHNLSVTPNTGNNDAVTVNADNVYDGMRLHVVIPYKNAGTVPVITKDITNSDITPALPTGINVGDATADTASVKVIGASMRTFLGDLAAPGQVITDRILKPGESACFVYDLEINNVQPNQKFDFTIAPKFQQYNMAF